MEKTLNTIRNLMKKDKLEKAFEDIEEISHLVKGDYPDQVVLLLRELSSISEAAKNNIISWREESDEGCIQGAKAVKRN